jgi:DNA-binding FrmR family transcriptional regulator
VVAAGSTVSPEYTPRGYLSDWSARVQPGYAGNKEVVQKRLRRIEGQVRGLQRMVDEDRYCINILEQVAAATKALQSVALELLDNHLAHCVVDAVKAGGTEGTLKLTEASAAIGRLVRS